MTSMRKARDGHGMLTDGIGDGQLRLDQGDGYVNVTVQAARGTFPTSVLITMDDARAIGEELIRLAG